MSIFNVLLKIQLTKKDNFKSTREKMIRMADLSIEEKNKLIKENPAYDFLK